MARPHIENVVSMCHRVPQLLIHEFINDYIICFLEAVVKSTYPYPEIFLFFGKMPVIFLKQPQGDSLCCEMSLLKQ